MPIAQVVSAPRQPRKPRTPSHPFNVRGRPFQIMPFCIAPVLPGETMKNALLQASIVTDGIKNPLIGWWVDHHLFYVKHRDLDERELLTSMMLDQATDVSSLKQTVAASAKHYTFLGGMKWSEMCLKRVVEEYFREEGEAWDNYTLDGLPLAKINTVDAFDSLMLDADMPDGADDTLSGTQFQDDAAYRQWQFMMSNQLVNMSYEDYLRTFGVRSAAVEVHKPELLRSWRNWQHPANTISPTTGDPVSAVRWIVAERADKDRFFTEPGFIFGVCVVRPKVYRSLIVGSAAGAMDNAFMWLPASMSTAVYTSLKKYAAGAGPIPGASADYWFDVRDLLVYGEQFINEFGSGQSQVALPINALTNAEYPDATMIDALFKDADNKIKQDGIISFNIHGTQVDHT